MMVYQWMPIASAPMDEPGRFLVFMPEHKNRLVEVCHVLRTSNSMLRIIGGHFAWDMPEPTHWMPIPDPPNA